MGLTVYSAREEELLRGCLRRDPAAQRQLYDSYSPRMYSVCYRYVRDEMIAEDVMVTAFTRVFDKIDQFKGEGSLEGWVRRIMVNEALTHLRKARTMQVHTDLDNAGPVPDADSSADNLEAEDLLQMIARLPPGYRIVFNMYAIDGYSHREIADHLGITENTSKSQLSRARVFLQRLLARHMDITTEKIITDGTT